jgi:hypothetical protein
MKNLKICTSGENTKRLNALAAVRDKKIDSVVTIEEKTAILTGKMPEEYYHGKYNKDYHTDTQDQI